jgi:hypothetical protein
MKMRRIFEAVAVPQARPGAYSSIG